MEVEMEVLSWKEVVQEAVSLSGLMQDFNTYWLKSGQIVQLGNRNCLQKKEKSSLRLKLDAQAVLWSQKIFPFILTRHWNVDSSISHHGHRLSAKDLEKVAGLNLQFLEAATKCYIFYYCHIILHQTTIILCFLSVRVKANVSLLVLYQLKSPKHKEPFLNDSWLSAHQTRFINRCFCWVCSTFHLSLNFSLLWFFTWSSAERFSVISSRCEWSHQWRTSQ